MPRTVYVLSKSSMDAVAAMTPDWDQLAVMVKNGTLMAPRAMATVLAEQENPASSWVDMFPFAFVEPWPLTKEKELTLRSRHPIAAVKEDQDRTLNIEAVAMAMAMSEQPGNADVTFSPVVAGDARVKESIYEIVDVPEDRIPAVTPVELLYENGINFTPPPGSFIGLKGILKDFHIPETDLYGNPV